MSALTRWDVLGVLDKRARGRGEDHISRAQIAARLKGDQREVDLLIDQAIIAGHITESRDHRGDFELTEDGGTIFAWRLM